MTKASANRLKAFGALLISAGAMLLVTSVLQKIGSYARSLTSVGARIEPPRIATLSDAKVALPKALDEIYRFLNDGDPAGASAYLSPSILSNTGTLDFICRPFTFRAYYIEAVAARNNDRFQVRVRVLLRSLDERAHTMVFHVAKDQCVLESVQQTGDDWFEPQKAEAADLVRRFLYAAKAGENEIAKRTVSGRFPFSECVTDEAVNKHIAWLQEVQIRTSVRKDRGIKLVAEVTFPEPLGWTSEKRFYVERIGGALKIVGAFYRGDVDAWQWSRGSHCEDPDLERYTLQRFGLGGESEATKPSLIYKVDPKYSEEARVANFSGTVSVSLLVGEDGAPRNIRVIDSPGLGLNETIIEAVRQWRFKPGVKDGQPVDAPITIEISFARP